MEPKNLDEAVELVLVELSQDNIYDIQETEEEWAAICLNGMAIRNEWNLWFESPLSLWFASKGIYHADDMSGIICKEVWNRVKKKKSVDMDEEFTYYSKYWEAEGCDVKAEFEERCSRGD